MIALLLTLFGLGLVVLPGISDQPHRLPPAEWARVAGLAVLVGFAAFEIGLILLALPTVLRALHAAGIAEICEHVLRPLSPGGDLTGWTAIVLALVVGTRALRTAQRAMKSTVEVEAEPWLGRHEDRGDFELVVLPTNQLLAVSAPAGHPQVLISDGLVERLDTDQLEAVIRHEATHLRCGHWRFSLLATVVERSLSPLPLVGRSTRALRNALERWADEAAAGRSAAERAVVRDAIVAVAGPLDERMPDPASEAAIRDRTRRLERRPASAALVARLAVHAPVLVLALTSVSLLIGWAVGAHHAVALHGFCPD
jgi:Peptidase family M48